MTRKLQIRRKKFSPICAAAIFAACREPSARTCLSYAVIQISIEGESEFSRRPIGSENSGDNKTKKTKSGAAGFAFFGYFFGEAKK
jgi:hypothetical protein